VDIGTWEVPQENIAKHREVITKIYQNIKSKPELFSTLKASKLFIIGAETETKKSESERWCYIDEYESKEGYESNTKALDEPDATALRNIWFTLIRPGSFKSELWDSANTEKIWI
jgi:phage-related protein